MKTIDIVKGINQLLAGERHSMTELALHMDQAIDDINTRLGATFPSFSELGPTLADYDFFPDRYIRSVLMVGAAWYYFVTDEEGEVAAQQYTFMYEQNLFRMTRDYINLVPLEYRADLTYNVDTEQYDQNAATSLTIDDDVSNGPRGVNIDVSNIIP